MTENPAQTTNPGQAAIRGRPEYPSITEVNVRSGPGTNFAIAFKGPVGMSGLEILEVQVDAEQTPSDEGKVFQWFKLVFHGGAVGWVRDDLLSIQGDLSAFGYGVLPLDTFAFALTRDLAKAAPEKQDKAPAPEKKAADKAGAEPPTPKEPVAGDNIDRVQKAALAITAAFEGGGYHAYNNYDDGIISYGLIQFTLAAGTLAVVLDKYLARSQSDVANALRGYRDRIRAADPNLRHDENLKNLLLRAAEDPAMQDAQNDLAIANYWDRLMRDYISPRQYKTPLGLALLFDIAVNFGVGDWFVRKAEEQLGIPSGSVAGTNGVTEEQVIKIVTDLRKISHDKQAARDNLPGLRVRGDFWVDLVQRGDWNLQGDDGGFVNVNGRPVQVREP